MRKLDKLMESLIKENPEYEEVYKTLQKVNIDGDIKKILMKALIGKELASDKILYILNRL